MSRRIRTTRPELLELAAFAALTDAAARLMHAIPTLCDDAGRCPASPAFIAGAVFFARHKSPHVIGQLLTELQDCNLCQLYSTREGKFLQVVGWADKSHPNYQYIKRPHPARYPAPTQEPAPHGRNAELHRETTDLDLDQDQDREREAAAPHAHGLKPNPPASRPPGDRGYDQDDPRQRGLLAERVWKLLGEARQRVHHELGRSAPFPLPVITPGSEPRGFRDLRDRIREEGALAPRVCEAILQHVVDQAIDSGDPQWLSEKLFGEGAWRHARANLEDSGDVGERDDKPSNVIPLVTNTRPRSPQRSANDDPRIAPDPMVDEAIREFMADRGEA